MYADPSVEEATTMKSLFRRMFEIENASGVSLNLGGAGCVAGGEGRQCDAANAAEQSAAELLAEEEEERWSETSPTRGRRN